MPCKPCQEKHRPVLGTWLVAWEHGQCSVMDKVKFIYCIRSDRTVASRITGVCAVRYEYSTFVATAQDPHGTQVAPSSRSRFLTGGFCFVFPTIGRFATWRFYLGIDGWFAQRTRNHMPPNHPASLQSGASTSGLEPEQSFHCCYFKLCYFGR